MTIDWSKLKVSPNQFPKNKKYSGSLLIVGGGRCVWDDLEKFKERHKGTYDVMCVNDIVQHFPGKVTHAYSNDWKRLPHWVAGRRPAYQYRFQENIVVHTGWPWKSGNSALSAIYTGLALGYTNIILIGVPLDESGHYYDPEWVKTKFPRETPDEIWEEAKAFFNGKVKSLSGRTRDILGEYNGNKQRV